MFGAVWDLDGTLVDTAMNHYAAWRALLREHGRDLTYDEFRPTFGLRNDDILVHHFGFDPDPAHIEALGERKEELFRASLEREGVRTQPGARELVEHLHGLGAPQAIASSAPPANIDLMVRLLSLPFDAVVSGEEVALGKPAPDIFLRAAERLDLPPARVVVTEDAPAGVEAGKAAGSRVIAIAATFPAESLAAADLVVRSFAEVLWPAEQWQRFLGA
ncbi:MAG TPA: HAD family phosphatase [Chloroflexota bacterium]|nr:HAD family phosphatase [Chloroflexota bacterium]